MSHRQQLFPTSAIVIIDRPNEDGLSKVFIRWKPEPDGQGRYRSVSTFIWEGARGSGFGDDPAALEREIEAWRRTGAEVELTDLRKAPEVADQSRNGVKVLVHRQSGGTVVEADCKCFGIKGRTHSSIDCPSLSAP